MPEPRPVIVPLNGSYLTLSLIPEVYDHFQIAPGTVLEIWTTWRSSWRRIHACEPIYVPCQWSVFARVLGVGGINHFLDEVRLVECGTTAVLEDPNAVEIRPDPGPPNSQ